MTLMLFKVTGLQEIEDLCSHSVVNLHEATQMFVLVNYVRAITVKKPCKYGEYGLSSCSPCLPVLEFVCDVTRHVAHDKHSMCCT